MSYTPSIDLTTSPAGSSSVAPHPAPLVNADPPSSSPSDILDQQLPPLDAQAFTPLGPIVDRTVKAQYESLKSLVKDTLPSLPPKERPQHIIAQSQSSRAALLKTLVLLRWKRQADVWRYEDVPIPGSGQIGGSIGSGGSTASMNRDTKGKSKELVAPVTEAQRLASWADDQHEHVVRLRNHLKVIVDQVAGLRARNPDIETALDVLTTGEYSTLPKIIYEPHRNLHENDPTVVAETIKSMNRGIQYRLAINELIPPEMEVVDVRDGKAYLRANGLFDCTITTTTTDLKNPWYIVDINFLFVAKQDGGERNSKPMDLPEAVKNQIIQVVEPTLLYLPLREIVQDRDMAVNQEEGEKNAVLFKLFEVLQTLSLAYQLEALYSQAVHLIRSGWHDKIRLDMESDRKKFTVSYWRDSASDLSIANKTASALSTDQFAGQIEVAIVPVSPPMETIFLGSEHSYGQICQRHEIRVNWKAKDQWLGLPCRTEPLSDEESRVDSSNLDLERMLLRVVQHHADALAHAFQDFVVSRVSTGQNKVFDDDDVQLAQGETGISTLLRIYGTRWLTIQVNATSGRVDIKEAETVVGSVLEARLASGARYANMHPDKLIEVLIALRTAFIMEATEEKLVSLRLSISRQVPGTSEDHERFGLYTTVRGGRQLKPIICVGLTSSKSHSLLIILDGKRLRFGVGRFHVNTVGNDRSRRLLNLVWLDRERQRLVGTMISAVVPAGLEELRLIHAYCNATVCLELLQEQLVSRNIPFDTTESGPTQILSIHGQYLFPTANYSSLWPSSVSIRLQDWQDPSRLSFLAAYRLKGDLSSIPDVLSDGNSVDWASLSVKRKLDRIQLSSSADGATFINDILTYCTVICNSLLLALRILNEQTGKESLRLAKFGLASMILERDGTEALEISYSAETGQFSLRLLDMGGSIDESTQSRDGHLDSIEAELEKAVNARWREGGNVLEVFHYLDAVFPVLQLIVSPIGPAKEAEFRFCNLTTWLIVWTRPYHRNALEITFLNTEGIFIVTDAASSPNSTERKLLIDRLAPVPGLVPILEQAAASTASKIIDQGKVLVTPQTCAVETIERILVAVARLGSQSSESLPMPNGH